MKIRFGGADGAGGMDVDVVSVFDEVVVDVVVEDGVSGVVVIGGHVQALGGGDNCARGQRGCVTAIRFDGHGACDDVLFDFPFGHV